MARTTCGDCKFYNQITKGCQRFPPHPFLLMHPMKGPTFISAYPPIEKGNPSCGEYILLLAEA